MPRRLPSKDFRARRIVLTRDDFGYAPKPAEPANDLIDKGTWDSIVTLPDDVAVRTTNYHGTAIRQLHAPWGAWIECFGDEHDCMFPVMLDAADDFQAATFTALTATTGCPLRHFAVRWNRFPSGHGLRCPASIRSSTIGAAGKRCSHSGKPVMGSSRMHKNLKTTFGNWSAIRFLPKRHHSARVGSFAESLMESQTLPMRVRDRPTEIRARATDRFMSARPSIMLAGFNLRYSRSAMFSPFSPGPLLLRRYQFWNSSRIWDGRNHASRAPHSSDFEAKSEHLLPAVLQRIEECHSPKTLHRDRDAVQSGSSQRRRSARRWATGAIKAAGRMPLCRYRQRVHNLAKNISTHRTCGRTSSQRFLKIQMSLMRPMNSSQGIRECDEEALRQTENDKESRGCR